ncbi:MAG: hypothetical protein ACE5SW_12080 [Nitrososphaeraceae archaeon]
MSSTLKLFLLPYALSPYTLSIAYLLATASFTREPNFFVSCTFPLVILNDTTLTLIYRYMQFYKLLLFPFSFVSMKSTFEIVKPAASP